MLGGAEFLPSTIFMYKQISLSVIRSYLEALHSFLAALKCFYCFFHGAEIPCHI